MSNNTGTNKPFQNKTPEKAWAGKIENDKWVPHSTLKLDKRKAKQTEGYLKEKKLGY
jgi:uncharacterized heparinase superfamily protein